MILSYRRPIGATPAGLSGRQGASATECSQNALHKAWDIDNHLPV